MIAPDVLTKTRDLYVGKYIAHDQYPFEILSIETLTNEQPAKFLLHYIYDGQSHQQVSEHNVDWYLEPYWSKYPYIIEEMYP